MSILTETKKNLIRALEIKKGDRVLLLGRAPTLYAEALAEAGALVDRSLPAGGEEAFDLLLLPGTLAFLSAAAGQEKKTFLSGLISLLSPAGRLVLCCDNPMGMAFLSGAPSEESGKFFPGLSGKETSETETFCFLPELKNLLSSLPDTEAMLYYPYPDYRSPLFFYSDDRLPGPGELPHYDINFKKARFVTFQDTEAYDAVIKNGLFPEYSNSFLAVVKKKSSSAEKTRVIYKKFPENRGEAFRMETDILETPEGKFAKKTPLYPSGRVHLQKTAELTPRLADRYRDIPGVAVCLPRLSGDSLLYPFAEGKSLKEILLPLAAGRNYRAMEAYLKKFEDIISVGAREEDFHPTEDYRKVFGDTAPEGRQTVTDLTNLDPAFENVLIDGNRWTLIDCEWCVSFPVPVKFILYRAGFYFARREEDPATYDYVMSVFGIPFDEQDLFARMEEAFQAYVAAGEEPIQLICLKEKKPAISLSRAADRLLPETEWRLVFDYGDGYLDANALPLTVPGQGERPVVLSFEPGTKAVRVDAGSRPGFAVLKNFSDLPEDLEVTTNGRQVNGGIFFFKNEGPKFMFRAKGFSGSFTAVFERPEGDEEIGLIDRVLSLQEQKISDAAWEAAPLVKKKWLKLQKDFNNTPLAKRLQDIYYFGRGGTREARIYDREHPKDINDQSRSPYENYIQMLEPALLDSGSVEEDIRFSIIVPVTGASGNFFSICIGSVLGQTYRNFSLFLVDDAAENPAVQGVLSSHENTPGVRILHRPTRGGTAAAVNFGMEAADGDYILLLPCDDVLSPCALKEAAIYLHEHPDTDYLYTDEDRVTWVPPYEDIRHDPAFKPDWSPDTFWSFHFTGPMGLFRTSLVKETGGFADGLSGEEGYDFVFRFLEHSSDKRVGHIAKVLYHRRSLPGVDEDSSLTDPACLAARRQLKEAALKRRGLRGEIEPIPEVHRERPVYALAEEDFLSIIIPSKDHPDILFTCIDSILAVSDGVKKEIVVVDNGSTETNRQRVEAYAAGKPVTYLYKPQEFNFSAMINQGAAAAAGNVLLLLNDDTEMKTPLALKRMLGQAKQAWTGAVGARLLYPDGDHIQHLGVINNALGPSHAFLKDSDKEVLPGLRNRADYDYIAVTGACLMVTKEKFLAAGGFDEELRVAYNDVDFCFSLVEKGYYNVVRNDCVFLHYESLSRGLDVKDEKKIARLNREADILYSRHPAFYRHDPFYNRNLIGNDEHFSIALSAARPYSKRLPDSPSVPLMEKDFSCTIDSFSYLADWESLEISGWYETGAGKADNTRKALAVFRDGDRILFYTTEKVKRREMFDTRRLLGAKRKDLAIITTGFYIRVRDLPPGSWQLGIALSDTDAYIVKYTDKVINL